MDPKLWLLCAVAYSVITTGNTFCNEATSPTGNNGKIATTDYYIQLPFASNLSRRALDPPKFVQKDVTDMDEFDLVNRKTIEAESDFKSKGKGVPLQSKKVIGKEFDPNSFRYETDGLLLGKVKWNYPMKQEQQQQQRFYGKDLYESTVQTTGNRELFDGVGNTKTNWFHNHHRHDHLDNGLGQEIQDGSQYVRKFNANALLGGTKYATHGKVGQLEVSQSHLGQAGNMRDTFSFGTGGHFGYPVGCPRCDSNLQSKPLIININSDCSGNPSRISYGTVPVGRQQESVMSRFKFDSMQQELPKYQVPKLSEMAHFYYM